METARRVSLVASESVRVTNPAGTSPLVLTCDHASNFVPPEYGALGLSETHLSAHIAWDPGALAVARGISERLDTALIETRISRLILDCNRPLDAPDLISEISETTAIPGNRGLSAGERNARIARCWKPFHDAVDAVLDDRNRAGLPSWLVSVHSFTPVYKGVHRPWHIGIIHDEDTRLALPLIAALEELPGITVGVNEPYSPADRVYFTLEQHARPRGLPCAMIEIRNDEIRDGAGQEKWAATLAKIFATLRPLQSHSEERIPEKRRQAI